ncbi:MAG: DNA topoisomerase VI, partial [Candidatus Diapherotrites archaeon]|nr:DNA topoisomerase VI [Candidatus Diapherotrites archaeon]
MAKETAEKKDRQVVKKLEESGAEILSQIEKKHDPKIELPVRTLGNIYFDQKTKTIKLGDKTSFRNFLNIAHTRKFMQTVLVASEIKKVIQEQATVSIRDLYYALKHTIEGTNENSFENQSESDPVIEDLEAATNLLREELHLSASSKGVVTGDMKIKDG